MRVQIVTDSGSDMTRELAEANGVTVVPLHVLIGGQTYRDGVDLTAEQFYQKMREHRELPKTSQPTPHELMAAYQEAGQYGPVIGIHLSSALSGTCHSAMMASRQLGDTVTVFDSLTGSGATMLMALEAAKLALAGAGLLEILQKLEQMRTQTRTFVALNTLENAVRGGRVKPLAGMAASLLGIKPIVHVTPEGKVESVDKVRGRAKALDRLLELAAECRQDWADRLAVVAHGNCLAEAEAFAQRVAERFHPRDVLIVPIGATIGTYAAEGAILLGF